MASGLPQPIEFSPAFADERWALLHRVAAAGEQGEDGGAVIRFCRLAEGGGQQLILLLGGGGADPPAPSDRVRNGCRPVAPIRRLALVEVCGTRS